jgi:OOP family OmpA-OmpF porin
MYRYLLVATALLSASSLAYANIEVGGLAGLHVFSDTNGLGVGSGTVTMDADSQKNSAIFGLRLGVYFTEKIGVEGEVGIIPTEPRSTVFDITDLVYRASLVYQFRAEDPKNMLVPFVLAGGGAMSVVYTVNPQILAKETNPVFHVGVGLKYRTGNSDWTIRGDLRLLIPPSSKGGVTQDIEALVSINKEFGRKKPKKEAPPPTPKAVDDDPDHDGIKGAADKCPNEAEDFDGFQDADGCPDLDNDGDGIPDKDDKCPNEAEDKDGFQDADGCPDPDNDGDGIPDAVDKCPNEPETVNGYQDEDGCPDTIPDKVKQFTGAIQGISFKVSSAELAPASTVTLDKALAVLVEFKDVRLEIQGHTDDQPIGKGGKFADNQALSQARAESVKAYFVKKGVDESRLSAKGYGDSQPVDDPKPLKAAKLNAARAKNRRVEFKLVMADVKPPVMKSPAPPAPAPTPTPAPAPPAPAPKQ